MPQFYYNYKESHLQNGVNTLVNHIEQSTTREADKAISDFVQKHNARVILRTPTGYILYFPEMVDHRMQQGFFRESLLPWRPYLDRQVLLEEMTEETPGIISISEVIQFKNHPYQYELIVSATLQPIDEAAQVILMFLPYMLIAIVIISFIGAYIYSNILSKPLLKLNQTAKQMAQLDFSTQSSINTQDELGELSRSLNALSKNLQVSMNELRATNSQLKDDIQKEREQEAKRREFIATVSHELKTPITAVSGQLEGMIHHIGSYKDRDKYLKQSYQIMKEMEALVHEILEVSQLESFDYSPKLKRINLSLLLEELLEQFLYFQELKNIAIIVNISPNIYIEADKQLITKAIANIISNAVNYTAEHERVLVSLMDNGHDAVLEVINSGTFIDPNEMDKIFQPFYRIDKSRNRKTGGSGLGLYIVQKILKMHQLQYNIENSADGVKFTICFKKEI